jgi:ATP/maltotriose-dependent transcriptional regulator MalT
VAGARGDRPLRCARGRGGRPARRRPQPARLPGGAVGDDRALRRGTRDDGGGPRRVRRAAAGRDRRLLALLDGIAETPAGDHAAAERAVRDAEAIISGSETRWYEAFIYADIAHAVLAQGRLDEAAAAVARIETLPAPCDTEWSIKRHTARALLAARQGDPERGLADAHAAVAVGEATGLMICRANAHRTLAELLLACGRPEDAAASALRALALDEAKGNTVAAANTRGRFAGLLDG